MRRHDLEGLIRASTLVDCIVTQKGTPDGPELTVTLDPPSNPYHRVRIMDWVGEKDFQVRDKWVDTEYKAVLAAVRYCQFMEV